MTDQPSRLLRISEVLKRTGLKRSTLYRKVESGSFPKQIQISSRCVAWRESAIERWLINPMFYRAEENIE